MRWFIRVVASVVGLAALLGVGYAVKRFGTTDVNRERFREGVEAAALIRRETGRDCDVRVEPVAAGGESVVVSIVFDDVPLEPGFRKELTRNANIVARRVVHHVSAVKVVFDDSSEVLPSWDGGVAVAGAPQPIGVEAPLPAPMPAVKPQLNPTGADAGVAAVPGKRAAGKTGQVTLVTFPEADVFRGAQKLGRTPLFNAELPVGTHLLTLVGTDGARRKLSLPVRLGKNKPMKLNLADLPAK